MIFSAGDYRFVVAFPVLGIVIKLPIIRGSVIWYHLTQIATHIWKGQWSLLRKRMEMYREMTVHHHFTLKSAIGKGIVDNWNERQFYKHNNLLFRILLQPTYCSLFGLVNIQKYGQPLPETENYEAFMEWWAKWYNIAGQGLIRDAHHFENTGNFHNDAGQIKFLDYGGVRTREVIDQYGLRFVREFPKL